MSVKDLTKITVTDLWKEFNGIGDSWEMQEEAVRDLGQGEALRPLLVDTTAPVRICDP
ncbi:MAG: hypothetical protein M1497_01750 [Nitrospirae bacterium]|nr:hypothetical protein [Nitrospirota bacterium]